ncbi:microsomal triglyceride transfer protein large subunit [Chelonus insularis]|uniref:microsomal triglyceride transfer protein large subunit n=1 Tax=Chelonus insularis TaxID=460826 RepID=UPI0015895E2A|nr:microsomal triglyceride transfer protein large subunit [Chelonus insularis]XP_034947068.1 microsomal triglyceride transfer protein large subunit [Chelonus insularis]
MAGHRRPVFLLVFSFCLLIFFGLHCQSAPAVVGATGGWSIGDGLKYQLMTTILSRESGASKPGGDVGFQLTGELIVSAIWQDPQDTKTVLLSVELKSPQLWIKSRRAPEPEGFIEHSSKLDQISESPILLLWKKGEILKVFLGNDETISSGNLKRGLASLFQYQDRDGEFREHDASGGCNVTYTVMDANRILKTKKFCDEINLSEKNEHPNPILGVNLQSTRITDYELNSQLLPIFIDEIEQHEVTLKVKPEAGTTVSSQRIIKEIPGHVNVKKINANNLKDALARFQPGYREAKIDLQVEKITCSDSGCLTLEKVIEENRDALENSALGTAKSAAAFLKLIPIVRETPVEELTRILKSPRYKTLKTQILDVLGSAATPSIHQVAMKVLRNDDIGDDTERYLWALSVSPLPHADIIKDVLSRSEETLQNDRVSETLALTAGAMARQLGSPVVKEKVRVSLEIGLDTCTSDECRLKFLRALRNLRSKASIPVLMDFAMNGTKSTSIAAWRALGSMDPKYITDDLKIAAKRIFYQIGGPKKDSTVRTLAADIVLNNDPSAEDIREFFEYLSTKDTMYEVKRYISQRLEQLAEKDPIFNERLNLAIEAEDKKLRNYHVLAHRGLSTAFSRPFLKSTASNGSLVTVQEVNSGLLKRGVVDVVIQTGSHEEALFSLGLFAGGLGSLVSSSDSEEKSSEPEEYELATAGMEIDLLGVGIRPFVFFTGQGELMGHVWSGTASERTPAFQAIVNLHRHRELVPLASGFIAEIDVEGAVSFDLAGQIQLSLWSRNAQSLVEMGAGVAVRGGFKIKSDYVQSNAEFALSVEPKLELSTDVDFSGPTVICMRLMQPETSVKHQIYKIERIPGSKHRLRKTKRTVVPSPARSYLLNRKNNEMCSKVFS